MMMMSYCFNLVIFVGLLVYITNRVLVVHQICMSRFVQNQVSEYISIKASREPIRKEQE